MRHVQFNETLTRGQSYVYLADSNGIENPRVVVGKLKTHGFPRDPTPGCASGFICSDNYTNPFEYGHIMAWELGGPNVPENIVPMYAEWQGSASTTHESWRNMEIAIATLVRGQDNQFIFVAVVEYANNGNTYPAQATRFSQWDQLFDWDDYRIPTGFTVNVEPVGSAFGQQLIAAFLTPGGLAGNHAAVCGALILAYGGTPSYTKVWDHSALPPQDRAALIRNVTAFAVDDAWVAHGALRDAQVAEGVMDLEAAGLQTQDAEEYAWAPFSPVHDEAYSFINDHPDEVQQVLETDYHIPHIEAQAVTPGIMVYGYYHGNPLKRDVKAWLQRRQKERDQRRKLKEKVKNIKAAKAYMLKHPK